MAMTTVRRINRALAARREAQTKNMDLRIEPEDEQIGALAVQTVEDVDRLVSEILSEVRTWPIVGLTARRGENRPALAPCTVRTIVGPEPPIYLISPLRTRRLKAQLPHDWHVFGGAARIWLPLTENNQGTHPLIDDSTGAFAKQALAELKSVFDSIRSWSPKADGNGCGHTRLRADAP